MLHVPVAVVFILISLRCFSTGLQWSSGNAHQFVMLLHVPEFNQPLVLAITAIVISFSIITVIHTASVIRTCCLLRSSCSPSQIYFQLALGLRVYFWEFISHSRSKLSPIHLPYDDLIQLVPGRQDLQFFGVYYSTSLLYLTYKPPPHSDVVLPHFVPGILASTTKPLALIQHLATDEHLVSLPPRNLVTEHLATAFDDLGCLESAGSHGSLPGLWEDQFHNILF